MARSLFRICGRGFFAWRAPRMWGILTECCAEAARLRFIPTRVGNTAHTAPPRLCRAVHPHACGEYSARPAAMDSGIGSSPRVWGILHLFFAPMPASRFIPTRVGNTEFFLQIKQLASGSSPRVWGIQTKTKQFSVIQRFIPTRVGNTNMQMVSGLLWTVHPHACGEYGVRGRSASPPRGSSPRVWGIPLTRLMRILMVRFIPTRVGNTRENITS